MSIRKLAALAWLLYAARLARLVYLTALVGELEVAIPASILAAIDAAIGWRIWAGRTPVPVIAAALWGGVWLAFGTGLLLYDPGLAWLEFFFFDWLGFLLQALATALSLAALVRLRLLAEEQRPPT